MAMSQFAQFGPLLTSEEQYHKDLGVNVRLSPEQEQVLLDRARSGEKQAGDEIVESLLFYVKNVAFRYAGICRVSGRVRIEYLDLVQIGNVTALETLQKALTHPNPYGYLKRAIAGEIVRYCMKYGSLIVSPQGRSGKLLPMREVESYDVPLEGGSSSEGKTFADFLEAPVKTPDSERDYTPLYVALESLTPKQRDIVVRHYGINGTSETLFEISCSILAAQGKPMKDSANAAYSSHACALATLKKRIPSSSVESGRTTSCEVSA